MEKEFAVGMANAPFIRKTGGVTIMRLLHNPALKHPATAVALQSGSYWVQNGGSLLSP
jgi:hypothetical protein